MPAIDGRWAAKGHIELNSLCIEFACKGRAPHQEGRLDPMGGQVQPSETMAGTNHISEGEADGASARELGRAIRQYYEPVGRYARTVCPSAADADDATQATFAALLESVELERPPRAVRPWLFTVVRNHCLKILRAARRWVTPASSPGQPPGHPPGELAGELDGASSTNLDELGIASRVLVAIGELDAQHREVLLRRDFLGQTGPEVVESMQITLPAVKTRLLRAREFVKQEMKMHMEVEYSRLPRRQNEN